MPKKIKQIYYDGRIRIRKKLEPNYKLIFTVYSQNDTNKIEFEIGEEMFMKKLDKMANSVIYGIRWKRVD